MTTQAKEAMRGITKGQNTRSIRFSPFSVMAFYGLSGSEWWGPPTRSESSQHGPSRDRRVAKRKGKMESQAEKIEELEQEVASLKAERQEATEEAQKAMDKMAAEHAAKLGKMEVEHAAKLENMAVEHAAKLDKMAVEHAAELDRQASIISTILHLIRISAPR